RWKFAHSETGLYHWNRVNNNQSSNHLRMARAELANVGRIGVLANRPAGEVGALKRSIRIEYARNLIGAGRMEEARELLEGCTPGGASRWLGFAMRSGMRRLARKDVVRWLSAIEGWNA